MNPALNHHQPPYVVAKGLFYDGIGNEIGTEMALLEANKLNVAASINQAKEARSAHEAKLKQELSHNSAPHDGDIDDLGAHTGDDSGQYTCTLSLSASALYSVLLAAAAFNGSKATFKNIYIAY